MAETLSLHLTANGTDVAGDHTLNSLGRANTIEVVSLEQQVKTAFDRGTLRATGRRVYVPLRFSKRIDRSTPLLRRALVNKEVVAGEFRWYRPHPAGDGSTQHFFTLAFTQGRITGATLRLPDTLGAETATLPPLEDIELVFNEVSWRWEDGGIEHVDTLTAH